MADPGADQLIFARNIKSCFSLSHLLPKFQQRSNVDNVKMDSKLFNFTHPEKIVENLAESYKITDLKKIYPNTCVLPNNATVYREVASSQIKLFNNEKTLDKARKRLNTRRMNISKDWKELEEKEKEFRRNFIAFNKFVLENKDKRRRAEKKIEENRNILQARQAEIDKLIQDISDAEYIRSSMDKKINKYKLYQDFLEDVVLASELGFHTINEVMNRFFTLAQARQLLVRKGANDMKFMETSKRKLMKLIEEKNFVIMGLNNQIANLQARYENANIKALESEELVTQIKNNAVKQLGEIDTVKNSIWNVYVHMATSKKHPIKIKKDNVEEQMMYINRTLTELSKVNKLIKKKAIKVKQQ